MPIRGELPAPTMRAAWQKGAPEPRWSQVFDILWSPDLFVVLVLCAIGLSATVCALLFSSSFINTAT
jgi:hypothetical protein